MENNEDQPDDVRKATPVEEAVSDGTRDEKNRIIKGSKPKSAPANLNDAKEQRIKRCDIFKEKLLSSREKTKKPCHPKADIICRDNLSKNEYIEVLSTPKKNRGLSCKSTSMKKPHCKEKVSLSERMKELSKPKTRHVVDLLETWGSRLRPEIIDAVKSSLEKNCPMSPEQMEAYYNEKQAEHRGCGRRVRGKKCSSGKEKKREVCDDELDPIAVCEEYQMARRFMRHIISHLKNTSIDPEDRYDLTEVILSQLGSVLDYRPFGDGDRKFQMMFVLANGIACWVHSLNLAVAEKLAKQEARDAQEEIESEESEDEDVEEEQNKIAETTEEDEDETEAEEKAEQAEDAVAEEEAEETVVEEPEEAKDGEEQEEPEEEKSEPIEEEIPPETNDDNLLEEEVEQEDETVNNEEIEPENAVQETEEEVIKPDDDVVQEDDEEPPEVPEIKEEMEDGGEAQEKEEMEGGGEAEDEEEVKEEVKDLPDTEYIEDVETEVKESIASIEPPIEPGLAIQGLGEGDLFASEIPFVTFGKIMEMVVKFLDKYEEAELSEVRRRLQNAVLKKLTNLVLAEAPDALDSSMKVVLEVLAENIAVFMEDALPKSKVIDIETMAPEIESTEVRNWGHWLETVMDNATNWGRWIHEKVGEAEEKAGTKVTRGDWQDWINAIDREALRWRMFNLDTKHQMHHADLNLTHKKVLHRGRRRMSATLAPYQEKDETEINAYDFADEAEINDKKSDPIEFGEVEN